MKLRHPERLWSWSKALLVLLAICLFMPAADARRRKKPPNKNATVPKTEEARKEILRRAGTFIGDLKKKRSVKEGPKQRKENEQFAFNETVECVFKEPDPEDPPGGKTPKFYCIRDGEDFKVKYQAPSEYNPGVWGEILSTRLFWAMGFPADSIYPVKVLCQNCPRKPWKYLKNFYLKQDLERLKERVEAQGKEFFPRNQKMLDEANRVVAKYKPNGKGREKHLLFEEAVIEIKYKNKRRVERHEHQGWNWKEFDEIDKSDADRARQIRIERDALALLAAFIQHADNKAEQQRIICMDDKAKWKENGGEKCENPILMIQDLGFSFGSGWIFKGNDPKNKGRMVGRGTTADMAGFRDAPIWSDEQKCITDIRWFRPTGMKANKQVSEEGRKFLAAKLDAFRKNPKNVEELFEIARLEGNRIRADLTDEEKATCEKENTSRPKGQKKQCRYKEMFYTADQWIKPFNDRVDQILLKKNPCPSVDSF